MSDDKRLRAFLDASVLYPALLRNILMRLQAILRDRPHLPRAPIERTRRLMEESIEDAMVSGFEPLINTLTLRTPTTGMC